MTALVTSDGRVIDVAPFTPVQVNASGRPMLAAGSVPLSQWGQGVGVAGGRVVSFDQLYASQPWLHIMVNKIVRQVARLPLKVYRRDPDGSRERVSDGPLVDLLRSPSGPRGRMAAVDLKQWLLFDALVHGNSLVKKVRAEAGGPPTGLVPVPWPRVTFTPSGWGVADGGGPPRLIAFQDTVHVAWNATADGLGVSPLQPLGVTVRIEDGAQRHQAAMLANGARTPTAITMTPDFLSFEPDKRDQIIGNLRADVERLYAGPDNSGRPMLLPPGLATAPVGYTAVEAELIDQRRLTREEIAAVYDIPPPMVGILDHATYSNVAEMHRMLFTTVLGPWLTLIEERLMAQLVRGETAFDGLFVEFELKDVLRGDPVGEAQALTTQVQNGLLTINEARAVGNRPPFDDPLCDAPLIPANNVRPIGGAGLEEGPVA